MVNSLSDFKPFWVKALQSFGRQRVVGFDPMHSVTVWIAKGGRIVRHCGKRSTPFCSQQRHFALKLRVSNRSDGISQLPEKYAGG